jgi:iron complex outermembrane receptor protein
MGKIGQFAVRLSIGCSTTVMALAIGQTPAVAMAQTVRAKTTIQIPAQPLEQSLKDVARRTGVNILYSPALVSGRKASAINGTMTAEDAVSRLIAGTNLKIVGDGRGGLVLRVRRMGEARAARGAAGNAGAVGAAQVSAESDQADSVGDDIIVTANKRDERLKDVPSSVTALAGPKLLQQGATKLEDYAARVPGFTVQNVSVGGGLNQLTLRGITTGFAGNPTVGFYVDDTPFGGSGGIGSSVLSPDLDPADIERIEVLRGPQGTLYGAGAMGGLVKFVTRAPNTAEFSGRVQADLVSVDGGSTGYALRGSINVPIAETMAIRINGYTREDPGFIDDPVHGVKDVNKNRFAGGRASLLWKPSDDTTVRLSATIQHQDNDGSATIDVDSFTFRPLMGDLQHSRSPGADSLDTTLKIYDVRVTHDFGWAELMSVSSWGENRFSSNFDYTPSAKNLLSALFGVSGGGLVNTVNNLDKFTQEIRLTSPSANRVFWQAGLLYTSEHALAAQGIKPVNPTTGAVVPLPEILDSSIISTFKEIAAFVTVGYKFTDRFDISIGGRVSKNKQSATQTNIGLLASPSGNSKSRDTSFTFLINPRYRVTENLMVYGRIASGYRPGGPNLSRSPFEPDRLVNYEMGVKTDIFDKILSVDLSAFLIDWKNIQLGLIGSDGLGYFGNAARAKSKGIEASGLLRPIKGLQIAGNITYLDAYIDEDLVAPLTAIGKKGDRLPSTPHWAGSLNVDYDFELGGDWSGFVGASWRYTGQRRGDFANVFSFGRPRATLSSYDAFDLRAGLNYTQWTLSAFARNIADKRGYAAAFAQGAITAVSLTQPRTFGIALSRQF